MARREQRRYSEDAALDAQGENRQKTSKRGQGSKPDAPRSSGATSGRGSTGARKSANRPGASGTGSKKNVKSSSGSRRSGSRSGGGQGQKKR